MTHAQWVLVSDNGGWFLGWDVDGPSSTADPNDAIHFASTSAANTMVAYLDDQDAATAWMVSPAGRT